MGVPGWTVVFRGDRLKADLVAAAMEAHGIRTEVFGDHAYSAAMSFSDARLMVPDDQAEAAFELIRQAERAEAPEV